MAIALRQRPPYRGPLYPCRWRGHDDCRRGSRSIGIPDERRYLAAASPGAGLLSAGPAGSKSARAGTRSRRHPHRQSDRRGGDDRRRAIARRCRFESDDPRPGRAGGRPVLWTPDRSGLDGVHRGRISRHDDFLRERRESHAGPFDRPRQGVRHTHFARRKSAPDPAAAAGGRHRAGWCRRNGRIWRVGGERPGVSQRHPAKRAAVLDGLLRRSARHRGSGARVAARGAAVRAGPRASGVEGRRERGPEGGRPPWRGTTLAALDNRVSHRRVRARGRAPFAGRRQHSRQRPETALRSHARHQSRHYGDGHPARRKHSARAARRPVPPVDGTNPGASRRGIDLRRQRLAVGRRARGRTQDCQRTAGDPGLCGNGAHRSDRIRIFSDTRRAADSGTRLCGAGRNAGEPGCRGQRAIRPQVLRRLKSNWSVDCTGGRRSGSPAGSRSDCRPRRRHPPTPVVRSRAGGVSPVCRRPSDLPRPAASDRG